MQIEAPLTLLTLAFLAFPKPAPASALLMDDCSGCVGSDTGTTSVGATTCPGTMLALTTATVSAVLGCDDADPCGPYEDPCASTTTITWSTPCAGAIEWETTGAYPGESEWPVDGDGEEHTAKNFPQLGCGSHLETEVKLHGLTRTATAQCSVCH